MERLKNQRKFILNEKTAIFSGQSKGYSLVEIIVAMGLFSIVMTIFTGFFITLYRLQTTYRETASLQQEARIISEVFTRYAREAESVTIPSSCTTTCFVTFVIPRAAGSSEKIEVKLGRYNNQFKFAKKNPLDSWLSDSSLPNLSYGRIYIKSFNVSRETNTVYPKVLKYEFTLARKSSPQPGEQIFFRGYVNMRNEL